MKTTSIHPYRDARTASAVPGKGDQESGITMDSDSTSTQRQAPGRGRRISHRPYGEAHALAHSPDRIFPNRWKSPSHMGASVPVFVLGLDLPPGAKLLYGVLVRLAGGHKAVGGLDNDALAGLVGVSERTLQVYLSDLEREGLIARMPPVGTDRSSRYIFFDHPARHTQSKYDPRATSPLTLQELVSRQRFDRSLARISARRPRRREDV